jgi:hypothetical protein
MSGTSFPEVKNHKAVLITCAILSDAVASILGQCFIVQQKDKRTHGSYHTKERILEIYDTDWYTGG